MLGRLTKSEHVPYCKILIPRNVCPENANMCTCLKQDSKVSRTLVFICSAAADRVCGMAAAIVQDMILLMRSVFNHNIAISHMSSQRLVQSAGGWEQAKFPDNHIKSSKPALNPL